MLPILRPLTVEAIAPMKLSWCAEKVEALTPTRLQATLKLT